MSADSTTVIREADESDIPVISTLAHAIWPGTYGEILSSEQLRHMLNVIYSHSSLKQQFGEGHIFLLVEMNAETVGFASYSPDHTGGVFKVNKLYVHPMVQGKGIGKKLLERIISDIRSQKPRALRLNVNRHNPAKSFYEKLGFAVAGEEDIPIGEGYFMNDYIMEKPL